MLRDHKGLFAYPFGGYWKDVGTIESFWDAHMDLLKEDNKLNLFEKNWKINTRQYTYPPLYVGENAVIERSLVDKGCEIEGEIKNSVIFPGVKLEKGSKIYDSVIMANTVIEEGVVIERAIVAERVRIKKNVSIGKKDQITVIGEERVIDSSINNGGEQGAK